MVSTINLKPDDLKRIVCAYFEERGYSVDPESFRLTADMLCNSRMGPDLPTATGATISVTLPERVTPVDVVRKATAVGGWDK